MGSLEQWNGNKTRAQIKIAASPGGLTDEGDKLTKGNTIWINPKKGWHLCLDDEKSYALSHDKSADFERYTSSNSSSSSNTKKGKFDLGDRVCMTGTKGVSFFATTVTLKATVEQWNNDYTRMHIKILNSGDGAIYKGEELYKGKLIWTTPYSWKKCN